MESASDSTSLLQAAFRSRIRRPDTTIFNQAKLRWREQIKPRKGLGQLEEIACRIASLAHSLETKASRKRILLFCADHGVAEENVSAMAPDSTKTLLTAFLNGTAAINLICATVRSELEVIDLGVRDVTRSSPGLISRRIGNGTKNFLQSAAMTMTECLTALAVGRERAEAAAKDGIHLLGVGETGIANTSSAAALMAALLDLSPKSTVGFGTGISRTRKKRKIEIVQAALNLHGPFNDPFACLAKLGGFEIAAMVGAMLESSALGLPVVVDGFTSSVAALIAVRIAPEVLPYLFFSHTSGELGHPKLLKLLKARPLLRLGMRLGEGTGAALSMPIIETSVHLSTHLKVFTVR